MRTFEFFSNPAAHPTVPVAGFGELTRLPMRAHRSLPGYRPTPLLDCPLLADRLGVSSVLVKDEARRLGLPSFKILGASWAVLQTIGRTWLPSGTIGLTIDEIKENLQGHDGRTLVAATDGNHGRGVARMAALLGLGCTILVPDGTADARIAAIAGEGATVRTVLGTYDDAIAESANLADSSTLVISDTSWEGYEQTPRDVIDGYSTMFFEIDDELTARGMPQPTFVALQAGVGAFAAAGLRHYRGHVQIPVAGVVSTAVVEPTSANCLMASAKTAHLTEVPGPHRSSMAGLNCGLPSQIAWPIVAAGTDSFVAIADDLAYQAMHLLADVGVEAGESGAAGLGGLLAIIQDSAARDAAGLTPESRVLIVNTEGATDPVNYAAIMADRVDAGELR